MVNRIRRFKPWAAVAVLASVLMLGGCIRFGPQADEMADTVDTEAVQSGQPDTTDKADADPVEETVTEEDPAESPETLSDATASESDAEARQSETESAKDEKKGQRIEVAVIRNDSERIVEFDLNMLPSGYSLSGMSWTPIAEAPDVLDDADNPDGALPAENENAEEDIASSTQPEPIATTYSTAISAGKAETDGFFIDRNGQRIGYRYKAGQIGKTGTVRLDFRDGDGGSATWEAQIILGIPGLGSEPGDNEAEDAAE